MRQFKRGLSPDFIQRLNKEYESGGWWKAIADDPQLFIAIRDAYLNVYWKGNSLLRLRMEGDALVGEVHYKYLLRPDVANPYLPIEDGRPRGSNSADFFLNDLSDLAAVKRAADAYAGEEKSGVHKIVMSNPNIIDVEVAFGAINSESGARVAKRIDFAALREIKGIWELVFYEAKAFSNPELRAAGKDAPVVNQIKGYTLFLRDAQADVIDSYRTVCSNLRSLHGVKKRFSVMDDALTSIGEGTCEFKISADVRLVVFGYDGDQDKGLVWAEHRQKLRSSLGDRLLLKGEAKGLTRGISSSI